MIDNEFQDVLAGESPSAEFKHAKVIEYGKRFKLKVLIETGTCNGGTVEAVKAHFSDIYSVELHPYLYSRSKEKFKEASNVHLFFGDSEDMLRELLPTLTEKLLFWLDAHYSDETTARGKDETPIMRELEVIFSLCPDCVILIDDARAFRGDNGYPGLAELKKYVARKAPGWVFEIKDDIIRLHAGWPPKPEANDPIMEKR